MPCYALRVRSCEDVVWSRRKAPNLYVVIYQDGRVIHRTNAVKRNRTPEWDDICNLSSDSPITLRLWHDCLLRCRDICLGAVDTEISALLDLASADAEYIRLPLTSEDRGSGKHTGTVLVCLVRDGAAASTAIEQSKQNIGKLTHVSALIDTGSMVEDSQPAVKTFEAGLGIIIAKLDMIIHIGDEVAKIHPYANMAWKVLTSVYQAVKAEQATLEKLKKLVDTMVSVYSFTEETDALPKKIKTLEDKVLAIVKQTVECALFIREYSGHGFTTRAIRTTWDNADKTIDDLSDTLVKLKASLESTLTVEGIFLSMQGISLSTQILQKVDNLVQSDALKTLNAAEMNAASRLPCLQGTRVHLLDELTEWLTVSNAAGSILWLSGVAGSGKSTITTSISLSFRGLHRLGAFLFFDRNNPSQSHPNGVIRTLAYMLSRTNQHIASAISAVIQTDPEIINTPLQTQFEVLLLKPLSSVVNLLQGPILIILDALDECGDPASRKTLLSVISTEFPKLPPPFCFLITSRREADISKSFASRFVEKSVGTATSTQDVQHFISHELERIQQDNELGTAWPKEIQKQTVMNLAGGLFIWAATAIKYIDGYRPNDRIETLITNNSTSLDDLYSFTLSKSAPWDDRTFANDARAVLACIVFGKLPMTDTTIDALLGAGCSSANVLRYLGCVVQWRPGCVARVLHASFADYLTDNFRNKRAAWAIDMKIAHKILSLGCLRILNTQLRFNICGLEDSHILNVDVPNISSRVATNISPQLSYASCFWGTHIADSPFDQLILEDINNFFQSYFLFWLEVLSLIDQLTVALLTLDAAASYIKGHNRDLEELIVDMAKFLSVFTQLISQSIPHMYLSAVPATPKESRTARQFSRWFPNTLSFDSQLGLKWPAIQKVVQGHKDRVHSVTFLHDGRWLASGSHDNTVHIWDIHTGQLVCTPLRGHTGFVWSVAFSPNGSCTIASGSHDKTVRIWDAQTGALVAGPFTGHTSAVRSVTWSPDGTKIASGADDRTVCVWDAITGALLGGPFEGHTNIVWSVDFSPNGTQIASGSHDKTVRIWNAKTGALVVGPFTGHTDSVYAVHFSPNSKQIVSGSGDKTIRVWDTKTGALVAGPFTCHADRVQSVNFSPDGTQIATGSDDHTICIWDAHTGVLVTGPFTGHTDGVTSVHFSPDGTQLVSGSNDNTIRVWDVNGTLAAGSSFPGPADEVVSIHFSPDGTRIASGSQDNSVCVWDAQTGALVAGPFHCSDIRSVNFSPDGTQIALAQCSSVQICDAQTGIRIAGPFNGHTGWALSVCFSPKGKELAARYHDGSTCVWDSESGALVAGPFRDQFWLYSPCSICFSPDGTKIASGSGCTVCIWNAQTGEITAGPFIGHTGPVTSVSFSPDGTQIASGSDDKTVRVWNAQTGTLVTGPFIGHTAWVKSIHFSPDSMHIASGSKDTTIRVWDAQTGDLVAGPFTGHRDSVQSICFSPDGTRIVSSSRDHTIRVSQVGQLNQISPSTQMDTPLEKLLLFDFHSGWTKNNAGTLIFWVPPWLREGLYLPHNTLVISSKGTTNLDLSRFVHGTEWTKCFDPKIMDTK